MSAFMRCFKRLASPSVFLLILVQGSPSFYSQVKTSPQAQKQQPDNTIRVKVGLVQTDVMVFDRQGHFVPDLKMDQFELKVDGKVQPISFMELVSAGSDHDREIWAKAEGKSMSEATQPSPKMSEAAQPGSKMANPGRTLFIFLDDWHMEADSTVRSRNAIASLLNTSMGPNDRVGVFAASGQLAATQFLTNDKAALLASLEKYNFKNPGVQDMGRPPMTEAAAQSIEQNDYNVLAYFVGGIIGTAVEYAPPYGWRCTVPCRDLGPGDFNRAERDTRQRARDLADISNAISERTLSALRGLLQFAESLPGRKLVFFISDGFVLQYQRNDIVARLTDLTTAAARAGIMIYSLDSRGLVSGTPDAKTRPAPDATGQRMRMAANEVSAPWDALNALASDTGGRFLKNTNALDTALITTLSEISRYYLLAWPFDPEAVKPGKYSTIRVAVKGRSDLTARVRQGSLDLSQLVAQRKIEAANESASQNGFSLSPRPSSLEMEIYSKARTVVDMTRDELFEAYPSEFRNLEFEESQAELETVLEKVGEKVAVFFHDFPNTVSSEQVRRERLQYDGSVQDAVTQKFNYSVSLDKMGRLDEGRTDKNGREIAPERMSDYSFLTSGFVSLPIYFQPSHQFGSCFRCLGRERTEPRAYVIAFAQRPGVADIVGVFGPTVMQQRAQLLYQGFAWVDPQSYQIVRMKTDLLAPRTDVMLGRVTSEIWFSEMHFETIPEAFWLPQEVEVTMEYNRNLYRNRHHYSDYRVLVVAAHDKITPPVIKK
ncbi:MAG: VWA domain-containing protein [Acidobacteriota bacterium]